MEFRERGHVRRGATNRGGNAELLKEIRKLMTRLEAVELNQ